MLCGLLGTLYFILQIRNPEGIHLQNVEVELVTLNDGKATVVCPICLEEGIFVKTRPCSHLFHKHCIKKSVVNCGKSCPLCRGILT